MATAISAARGGASVTLLERSLEPGGIVGHGLIHTIGGLHDSAGGYLNAGLPVELAERLLAADPHTRARKIGRVWVLNVSPTVYLEATRRWLDEEAGVTLITGVSGAQPEVEERAVTAVTYVKEGRQFRRTADSLIDCTGEAAIIDAISPALLLDDDHDSLAGIIFRMQGVEVAELAFPKSVVIQRKISAAVANAELPIECANVWIDTGVFPDEVYVKLSVMVKNADPASPAAEAAAERIREATTRLVHFLARLPGFQSGEVVQTGRVSYRGGGRARGEYLLTAEDVRALRRFDDVACACAWPIEYWNPEKGVQLEYLAGDGAYDIPLRSLKVAGFTNLWTAGKSLSADHLAQASARVSGTCWAMGDAVGKAVTG
jgi:hypothetical protein